MNKARRLRDLLAGERLLRFVGAHSGLSARLVETHGFDGIWASGLEISASAGVPDASILTMTDILDRSTEMDEASALPVMCDCDTGYGSSTNAIRMVEKFERAGVAAVCIEDKVFPKRNSFAGVPQHLAPVSEFVGKLMACKSVQRTPDFLLVARTEALIAGAGLDEALLRAGQYAAAGADLILIHSKSKDPGEVVEFARRWNRRLPLVIVPTTYPSIMERFNDRELLDLGIRIVIFANHGIRAAIRAMDEAFAEIRRTGGVHTLGPRLVDLKTVFALQNTPRLDRDEERFTLPARADLQVVVPAAGAPKGQPTLEPLLADRPLCMIDLLGEPLLARNVRTLEAAGIPAANVRVVAGYRAEAITREGPLAEIRVVGNPDFETRHILHSFMLGAAGVDGPLLMAYSDILLGRDLLRPLLERKEPIVLVGDASFRRTGRRNKKLDLIGVAAPPESGPRDFAVGKLHPVVRIGVDLPGDAGFEFTGVALFNPQGLRAFQELHGRLAGGEAPQGPFHEAPSFGRACITDLLQELVDRGFPVQMLAVASGWTEIHSFDDYRRACQAQTDL